jgi:hypothetical protein
LDEQSKMGSIAMSGVFWGVAAAAGDDSIYMLPVVPLPDVLGQLPASESERQAFARQLLLELVQDPGVVDGS